MMNKLPQQSPDLTARNIEALAALFPSVITESRDEHGQLRRAINFEQLRQLLSPDVLAGDEAYEFTWVGKKAAMVEANRPIRKTLRPCKEESKAWDTTENLYIEGDNLDVLKLLQESYLGKVKMIYIDPPYNTGNDFIYRDDFSRSRDEEEEQMGMYDEEDNRLFRNTDSNGRFHSDWCSMMYARLMLARGLLTDDGVIFISIDDKEFCNLKYLANEIFGVSNYLGIIVWKNSTDNNPTNIAMEHEYVIVYAKSKQCISAEWKSKLSDVKKLLVAKGQELTTQYSDPKVLKEVYDAWYKENKSQLWPLDRYKYIDEGGIYTGSQSVHNPGREGYRYDIIHPVTGKACKQPLLGYRFPKQTMDSLISDGKILFGSDENKIIELKLYAIEYQEKLSSVFELDGRLGPYDLKTIFPEAIKVFTNPKPVQLIKSFISYTTDSDSFILDFFSGSATTAHAVLKLNAEDGGHRKFIMVQLPEPCDETSEAYKAGYRNICEIGKERIRRAGEKIKAEMDEANMQVKLGEEPKPVPDIGFRVLKLADTNMKDVYYSAGEYTQELLATLESNIKEDRTDLDLLFGCLLDWGVPLSMPCTSETLEGCAIHTYGNGTPPDLIACFAQHVPEAVVRAIAERQPLRVVFRDSSFAGSPQKINVTEIFKVIAPNTGVRVI